MDVVGREAVINAEVITLSRMAERVLSEIGENRQSISKTGKAMVIYDVLNQNKVNNTQTVFIATDSSYGLKKLKTLLYPIQVLSNQQVRRGHSTGAKRNVVHSTLADLFLLTRSKTLIGVDRSGFSYVAKALSRPKVVKWIHVY